MPDARTEAIVPQFWDYLEELKWKTKQVSDNGDTRWGVHNSAAETILEVKLLLTKIFCGWHENFPADLCLFLFIEPSVSITWEIVFIFLVMIYGVHLKNSEPINTWYGCSGTEKNSFLTALKDFLPIAVPESLKYNFWVLATEKVWGLTLSF